MYYQLCCCGAGLLFCALHSLVGESCMGFKYGLVETRLEDLLEEWEVVWGMLDWK